MWCLPTHKRPEKLQRFLDSMSSVDKEEEVFLMIWSGDPHLGEYEKMLFPKSWTVYVGRERTCGEKLNKAFGLFPRERFYGLLTDDVQLATEGMLGKLAERAAQGKVVWPDDGIWQERLSTHPVVPGELLRALGFWAHPRFPHNGIDSVLFIIGTELGLCEYMGECKIKVLHPSFGTAELDEAYLDGKVLNEQFSHEFDLFLRGQLYPLLRQTVERLHMEVSHG